MTPEEELAQAMIAYPAFRRAAKGRAQAVAQPPGLMRQQETMAPYIQDGRGQQKPDLQELSDLLSLIPGIGQLNGAVQTVPYLTGEKDRLKGLKTLIDIIPQFLPKGKVVWDMLGGRQAAGAPETKKAEADLAKGITPQEVWTRYGQVRHPATGSMLHWIPQGLDKLNPDLIRKADEGKSFAVKLGELMDAPPLYKAYPQLKELEVSVSPDKLPTSTYGKYVPAGKHGSPIIALNSHPDALSRSMLNPNKDPLLQGLHHETQHAVQDLEGLIGPPGRLSGSSYWNNIPEIEARFTEWAGLMKPSNMPYAGYKEDAMWYGGQRLGEYKANLKELERAMLEAERLQKVDPTANWRPR